MIKTAKPRTEHKGAAGQLRDRLNRFGPLLGLFLIYGLFCLIGPENFSSVRNLEMIALQTAIIGTAALGMTLVIINGGIDLSVGSIIALSTVVVALLLGAGVNPLLAAMGGIAAGAFCGFINGFLITRFKVVPFIVTLGSLLIVRGAAKGLASEQKVDAPMTWLNDLVAALIDPEKKWMLMPPGVWIMLILALAIAGLLRYTRLGRHIFAIGSNEQTARLCGIAVSRVKIIVFSLCGAFAGIAGIMQFSRLSVGDPTVAVGAELDVIAAVVIGGGSLSGGEGSILGSLVGALIMTVIRAGCSQMGMPNWLQEIVTGSIIILAVALDRLRHSRMS